LLQDAPELVDLLDFVGGHGQVAIVRLEAFGRHDAVALVRLEQ
jgi:hypothetical protein